MNCTYLHIHPLYMCKLNNMIPYNIMMTNSEMDMFMGKKVILLGALEAASLDDGTSTTLRVSLSGSAFCRNYPSLWEGHAEGDKNLLIDSLNY